MHRYPDAMEEAVDMRGQRGPTRDEYLDAVKSQGGSQFGSTSFVARRCCRPRSAGTGRSSSTRSTRCVPTPTAHEKSILFRGLAEATLA